VFIDVSANWLCLVFACLPLWWVGGCWVWLFVGYCIWKRKFSFCSLGLIGSHVSVVRLYGCWPGFAWLMLIIYGEFDPGSGRTLAACLTHASRTMMLGLALVD
jgi:hypothetical protein